MPRVPTLDTNVQESPLQLPRADFQSAVSTPEETQSGREFRRFNEVSTKIFAHEFKKANESKVLESSALLGLGAEDLEFTAKQITGKNVNKATEIALDNYKVLHDGLMADLQNEQQRQAFAAVSTAKKFSLESSLNKHALVENEKYNNEVRIANLEQVRREAATVENYQRPDSLQESIRKTSGLVIGHFLRHRPKGVFSEKELKILESPFSTDKKTEQKKQNILSSKPVIREALFQEKSKTLGAVLDTAINESNFPFAKAFFDEHRKEFTLQQQQKYAGKVGKGGLLNKLEVDTAAQDLVRRYGTLPLNEFINKVDGQPVNIRDAAVTRYQRDRKALQEDVNLNRVEDKNNAIAVIKDHIEKRREEGKSTTNIPIEEIFKDEKKVVLLDSQTPADRKELQGYANGYSSLDSKNLLNEILFEDERVIRDWSNSEALSKVSLLNSNDAPAATSHIKSVKDRTFNSSQTDAQRIMRSFRNSGLASTSNVDKAYVKWTKDAKKKYNAIIESIERDVFQELQATGNAKLTPERHQQIIDQNMLKVIQSVPRSSFNPFRVFGFTHRETSTILAQIKNERDFDAVKKGYVKFDQVPTRYVRPILNRLVSKFGSKKYPTDESKKTAISNEFFSLSIMGKIEQLERDIADADRLLQAQQKEREQIQARQRATN